MDIRDKYVMPAMHAMAAKKEAEIKAVLDDYCPGWTMVDIKSRCRLERMWNSPVETLIMDSTPLLEIYPPEFGEATLEGDRYVMRVTQNYRRL